jgi:hypothetical protein
VDRLYGSKLLPPLVEQQAFRLQPVLPVVTIARAPLLIEDVRADSDLLVAGANCVHEL